VSERSNHAGDVEHCVTCSDAAVLATVVAIDGATALVEHDGRREAIAIDLVPAAGVGDVLLCHAGVALEAPAQ
jgi:hydrogenase maturation factor